jgi:hypothetical protein
MGATSGAETVYPSGTPKFTIGLQWGSCYSIVSFRCLYFDDHCLSLLFWSLYSSSTYCF